MNRKGHTRANKAPLVEAFAGFHGDWQVEHTDTGGFTDNKNRVMRVPTQDVECPHCGKDHSGFTRLHESLHAKLSPLEPKPILVRYDGKDIEVSKENVEIAEEFRMNWSVQYTQGKNFLRNEAWCPNWNHAVKKAFQDDNWPDVIRAALAGGPGYYKRVRRLMTGAIKKADDADKEILENRQKLSVHRSTVTPIRS